MPAGVVKPLYKWRGGGLGDAFPKTCPRLQSKKTRTKIMWQSTIRHSSTNSHTPSTNSHSPSTNNHSPSTIRSCRESIRTTTICNTENIKLKGVYTTSLRESHRTRNTCTMCTSQVLNVEAILFLTWWCNRSNPFICTKLVLMPTFGIHTRKDSPCREKTLRVVHATGRSSISPPFWL